MFLAGHGITEDHGDAIWVQRALGISVVFEGFSSSGDCPLLRLIHSIGDARGNREMPFHGIPDLIAHPAANLRVRLVGGGVVRVVVESWVPTIGRDLSDAVAAGLYVVPESVDVRRIGQDGSC